jgi:glutamine synthetase
METFARRRRRRGRRRPAGIESLPDATRELERNEALRAAFAKTHDGDYLDYFVEVKRREVQSAHERITQWQLDRYLQLF